MKVTENSTYRLMQTNLDRITNDLQDLRYQGATGIKLNNPSDDPSAIRPVLTTRTQLRHTDRYLETMGVTLDKMESTDGHLAHVENILQRVKEIAITGINSALGPSDLETLADEVSQLNDELLDAANAMIDGKYIFSGYSENTIPFVENPDYDPDLWDQTNPNTWPYLYQGDGNSLELEITPGERLETMVTGNDLFLGISNSTMLSGPTVPPLSGMMDSSGPLVPGSGSDVTITVGTNPAYTIAAADLTNTDESYAQKVAGLLEASGGLAATVTPSYSSTSGVFSPVTDAGYSFNINGETLVSGTVTDGTAFDTQLDAYIATISGGDPTLAGGSIAGGDAWFTTNPNSHVITISGSAATGDLAFSAADGANITVTQTVATPLSEGFTTASYAAAAETTYGTVDIQTNTADDVVLANAAGLTSIGLTAGTLDGATAYTPDADRLDVFSSMARLEEALRAGNVNDPNGPGGGITQAIDNFETLADNERRIRSRLGNKATRVESAMLHQEDVRIDLEQVLSRYQDADAIEIFNEIVKQETAFSAALNITSRVSQISILDYF